MNQKPKQFRRSENSKQQNNSLGLSTAVAWADSKAVFAKDLKNRFHPDAKPNEGATSVASESQWGHCQGHCFSLCLKSKKPKL